MLSLYHWGELCEGQASELSAATEYECCSDCKGPGGVVLATLQLTMLVLHLTPSLDCF